MLLFSLLLSMLHWQCVDKYNSPYQSPATGYLVVEGYISGNTATQFTLSRTIPLPGDSAIPMETGARVQVEGNDNSVYPLAEQTTGIYVADSLALNAATQYRLRINTTEGEQYVSSFVQYKPTPPIDSVNWVYNSGSGVNIYVSTHDPTGNTRYYQWNYMETWQYTSAQQSELIYDTVRNTVNPRPPSQQDYNCWISANSVNILLGSTAKLAQDVVSDDLLTSIPTGAQRLSVEYSILVRQYALTVDGYNFLSLMQQNTESLGSIFDATPSPLTGNIQCLTNPSEPVVGWVSAGTVQQQRMFINWQQVPAWGYAYACGLPDTAVDDDSVHLLRFFDQYGYVPITQLNPGAPYESNLAGCVDCRLQGGTTREPSYWPN